jgi:hypothetical protein
MTVDRDEVERIRKRFMKLDKVREASDHPTFWYQRLTMEL